MSGRTLLSSALAALLLLGLLASPAWAHGGRFQGPGGRAPPGDPTTPMPSGPKRGPPAITPGTGIPTTTGALPDIYWGTWWALNRWAYLPERGAALRARRVTTGERIGPTPEQLTEERRALLARQHIKPFLLRMLDRTRGKRQRDTVTSAALLALAKIDASEATLELLLGMAEGGGATPLEQESAALAVGLLRRTDPKRRLDAISLDLARTRLLDIIAKPKAPTRSRCFAAFALGLLADQPYGSPFSKDGRLVVKGLLARLAERHVHPDLPIALLSALALQPRDGIPTKCAEDLRRAVGGVHVYKRPWSPLERAHALSTYARLRADGWLLLCLRALGDRRLPTPVQRAARLALGEGAADLTPEERVDAAKALVRSARHAPDHLSEGLGQIALARIVQAELRTDATAVLEETKAGELLLEKARKSYVPVRGFHAVALALAARDVQSHHEGIGAFTRAARETLLAGFDRPRGDNDLRGAYAVALGLLKATEARDRLVAVLNERNAGPSLRSRAAIALAQIGALDDDVRVGLRQVMADTRPLAPRSSAALALSLLTGTPQSDALVRQLRTATSQREQVAAAAALGQLEDPKSLPAVTQVALEYKQNFEIRALAIAILGLIGDPEATPSLFRLSLDANYIARTDALHQAFSLL